PRCPCGISPSSSIRGKTGDRGTSGVKRGTRCLRLLTRPGCATLDTSCARNARRIREDNMAKVDMSVSLNAPADKVWNVIRGFDALPRWHPAVARSEETRE